VPQSKRLYRHTGHPARYAAAVATFWRYVKIQLMVFVCGIVGPIFLQFTLGRNRIRR
jgi:hypothetical protein